MNEYPYNYEETSVDRESGFRDYIRSVFVQMALGLLLTAALAFACYQSILTRGLVYRIIVSMPFIPIVLIVAELAVALTMSFAFRKLSSTMVQVLFYAYAAITGISFSVIFLAYDIGTVFLAFVISAVFFGCMAFIGYRTEKDLSGFGPYLIAGLIATIVVSIIGIIFRIQMLDMVIAYIGLALFIGLTAFDMQKVKRLYFSGELEEEDAKKLGTYGAMELYLDFINIFLKVLRILGNRRSNN